MTFSSTCSRVMASALRSGASCMPTLLTHATISTPYHVRSTFSAMAPAATRPMVSRALLRPLAWALLGALATVVVYALVARDSGGLDITTGSFSSATPFFF